MFEIAIVILLTVIAGGVLLQSEGGKIFIQKIDVVGRWLVKWWILIIFWCILWICGYYLALSLQEQYSTASSSSTKGLITFELIGQIGDAYTLTWQTNYFPDTFLYIDEKKAFQKMIADGISEQKAFDAVKAHRQEEIVSVQTDNNLTPWEEQAMLRLWQNGATSLQSLKALNEHRLRVQSDASIQIKIAIFILLIVLIIIKRLYWKRMVIYFIGFTILSILFSLVSLSPSDTPMLYL